MEPLLVIGCNYHTTWQKHKAMRFVLLEISESKQTVRLGTRTTNKTFWTYTKELIFIESEHNKQKAIKLGVKTCPICHKFNVSSEHINTCIKSAIKFEHEENIWK